MRNVGQILRSLSLTVLGAWFLGSCQKPETFDKSGLPISLVDQLDATSREYLSGADYQIYKYGSLKAYVVVLAADFCGSAGCQTFIFVEKEGKVKKIYEEPARSVSVNPVYPDVLRFTVGRSGAVCGKPYNSEECYLLIAWPTKS